jgi:hypothetical protein
LFTCSGGGGASTASGGGGSSYCGSTPFPVTYTSGFQSSNGYVAITFATTPLPSSQPSRQPSSQPSKQPTRTPTSQPSGQPTLPSGQPTNRPTQQPTEQPSNRPTSQPSLVPSRLPTNQPSSQPTFCPSSLPTRQPLSIPSSQPSSLPSIQPSSQPSAQPTMKPSTQPSLQPSSQPTCHPTTQPSNQPSSRPSHQPSNQPSTKPTAQPTKRPSSQPTAQPSSLPSRQPTSQPTMQPSSQPTEQPSCQPSSQPSFQPSAHPTNQPSRQPTVQPSCNPTEQPSSQPSTLPSIQPTSQPTDQPSIQPSLQPTDQPSSLPSSQPTESPTTQPTSSPSGQPTIVPTVFPSCQPSSVPSSFPSSQPSNQPTTHPSGFPTSQPSSFPSSQPTVIPTGQPTLQPTGSPSSQPTMVPSRQPSSYPSSQPSTLPTNLPTSQPTSMPTREPTCFPSSQPSNVPSIQPSAVPSSQPTLIPTVQPTQDPTNQPTSNPSCQPSTCPTSQPTVTPSNQPTDSPTNQPSSLPTRLPSSQPSDSPSIQPISYPTSGPSSQPTVIPSAQPFAFPTSAPVATIYQTNGVLHWMGTTSPGSNNTKHENNGGTLGTSYILFGRNFKHQSKFPFTISLTSLSSREFVSEISKNEGGIRHDVAVRSTTIVGDINGDTYLDLLVGYPLASKCSVYLGDETNDFSTIIATTGESFAIIGDPYDGGGFLGWSSIRIGDLNGDGFDEIIVSAIYANIVYVIYGKREFVQSNIYVNALTINEGFKIIGHPDDINFGVSLTLLHDFRKGSRTDLAITAQQISAGQNMIYVLFGLALFKDFNNIEISRIIHDPNYCIKIVPPAFSYAGFSVAGIGDINSDGFDDLAIGSTPYGYRGFNEQKTYIVYGRKPDVSNELHLAEMTSKDGFIISGGGFVVVGVDDLNADGVHDVMITSYYDWSGQKSAYLIASPANVTYSPSLQPSSTPTMLPILLSKLSSDNSEDNNSTLFRSRKPSFRPSFVVDFQKNQSFLPTRAVFSVGTARPSSGEPSLSPTFSPTVGFHRLRGTVTPTIMPTFETTAYSEIDCSGEGNYQGKYSTHNLFRITADTGFVNIIGNDEREAKNLYVLYCPSDPVNVVIKNFRLSTDIISVAHLDFSYTTVQEIAYSLRSGPLTLFFCSESKLQVILSSFTSFELQDENFLFTPVHTREASKYAVKNSILARVQIGIVFGIMAFIIIVLLVLAYQNKKQEEKEKLKHEKEWLNSSTDYIAVQPILDPLDEAEGRHSRSSSATLVVETDFNHELIERSETFHINIVVENQQQEEEEQEEEKVSQNNGELSTVSSNGWFAAIAISDDGDDDQIQPECLLNPTRYQSKNERTNLKSNCFKHNVLSDHSSSLSSSTSSHLSFVEDFDFPEVAFISQEDENSGNDITDDISSINTGDWEDALALSTNNNSDEWEDALALSDDNEEFIAT